MAFLLARADWAGLLRKLGMRLRTSTFVRNAFYLTGITGVERVAGLAQTVLLARALGITEYGIYGLLFSTIGLVASVMGLQMGLTATVFVARYRQNQKARAGAVIRYVMRFAVIVSAIFLLAALPFAKPLSAWLLKSGGYHLALSLGCLFVASSLLSGVQDGIAEGFEDFRAVAIARLVGTVTTLALIYPASIRHGLDGALVVLLAGVVIKYAILAIVIARHRRREAIPRQGGDVSFVGLVRDFSLPSMLVSLLWGVVMWYGTFLLSRAPAGFAAVAIVSVGLQWRGPLTLVTGALGRVAVPVFSRYEGTGDRDTSRRFKRKLMWLNGITVVGVVALLIAAAHFILGMYGKDFHAGWAVFVLLLLGAIPKVMADVHMQELVGHGRIWRQLWVYLPLLFVTLAGFMFLIPRSGGVGYGIAMLVGSSVFLVTATLSGRTRPSNVAGAS